MAHKLRSFLMMFGIIRGMVSTVLLSALSAGFQQGNMYAQKELGKNIIISSMLFCFTQSQSSR
jgi:ABC-type antimicrobial peptide transport system permease subunit